MLLTLVTFYLQAKPSKSKADADILNAVVETPLAKMLQ